MGIVVLPEDEGGEVPLPIQHRQGVELVVPEHVVGFLQGGAERRGDDLPGGGHEVRDRGIQAHAAHPVVPAGDKAQELAGAGAVRRHGHGGVAGAGLQGQHVPEGGGGQQVGVAGHEARLIALHLPHHLRLLLNGLGDEDEGDAALPRQGHAHLLAGDGLHHGGDHGHVHGEGAFLPFAVADDRRLQGDIGRDGVGARVAGHQQVLAESVGGFLEVESHSVTSFLRY